MCWNYVKSTHELFHLVLILCDEIGIIIFILQIKAQKAK